MSGAIEKIGDASCPSGKLVILDGGWAWLWSHDRPPIHPRLPMIVGAAENARDLAIRGPDAIEAGLDFDHSGNPLYVFDIAGDQLSTIHASFQSMVADRKLDATLETLAQRVPHRRRLELSLDVGEGVGLVNFHGMTAAAVGGLQSERLFPVYGEKMPDGGCWRKVWIEFGTGLVAEQGLIGDVSVDEARLMIIDGDALGLWDDINSIDGRADVVFWGGEASQVAQETGAEAVAGDYDGVFGWLDLPIAEAEARAAATLALQSETKRFALDFRPHTHQWAIMREVRRTATSSGQLDLGGARVCMFHTLLGDGAFPVTRNWMRMGTCCARSSS